MVFIDNDNKKYHGKILGVCCCGTAPSLHFLLKMISLTCSFLCFIVITMNLPPETCRCLQIFNHKLSKQFQFHVEKKPHNTPVGN